MLEGIHFLLTYNCNFECDHCFLWCSPQAQGTFTVAQIREVLQESARLGTVEWIFFEGGEPFLYHPLLLAGVSMARENGFKVGLVTNGYWATAEEDAELWLQPLDRLGIGDLSISDDSFHQSDDNTNTARIGMAAAKKLGMAVGSICIDMPEVQFDESDPRKKGQPVIGGGAKFRGRAVEKLTEGLPRRPYQEFTSCPHEELEKPGRVHVDSFGHVHICQGLTMGNMWETPLSSLVSNYRSSKHPICGPLVSGGPAELARVYGITPEASYVDACHFCYLARRELVDRFPEYLAPRQVYGLE